MTTHPYPELHSAITALLTRCDGARTLDGVGFNGFDAPFATDLAYATRWTPGQARAAHKMLRKYRGQLASLNVNYDELPAVPEEEAPARRITVHDDRFMIEFPYDPALVAAVKDIPGRTFDGEQRAWRAPLSSRAQIITFAEANGFHIPADVYDMPDVPVDSRPRIDTGFSITFDYDRKLVERVKEIPGARWSTIRRVWEVPGDCYMEVLEFANATDAVLTEAAQADLAQANAALELMEQSSAQDALLEVPGLGGTLLPFQRAGVAYASRVRRCFIADEMGLGKTVQALATLQNTDAFPAVIVCPASLKTNWEREATRWLPGRTVQMLSGTNPHATSGDVLIINYDVIHAWVDALPALNGLILDESHYVKSATARRSKACIKLSDRVDSNGVILALTGTPVLNDPQELVSTLRILKQLPAFGGVRGFKQRYTNPRHLGDLNRRLRATCYVRRRKMDVLTELPAKRWSTVVIDGDAQIMREYRAAEADLIGYLAANARKAAKESGATDEQARTAAWEASLRASSAQYLVAISTLRQIAARAKMPAALHWMNDFNDTGKKLVVFGWHRETLDALPGTLKPITGEATTEQRQAAVDAFQNDDRHKTIALSIRAGGVGLTLTAASDVLFLEQGWTPGEMDQAADRCHRIGQQDSVTAWVMLTANTIDEDIAELIEHKRTIVDAATDGATAVEDDSSILQDLLISLTRRGLAA